MSGHTTWKDYVESFLIGSGMVSKAAIFGSEKRDRLGTVKSEITLNEWAASKGFFVGSSEVVSIWRSFTDPTEIRANGMVVGTDTYTCIRADSDLIVGRTAEGGCIISRAKHLLVIAVFDDPFQANCWNMVLKLVTFLRDHGF